MGKAAINIGASTFQFFTRNPRGGPAKPIDEKDIAEYLEFAEKNELQPILAHAPYTINPCASDSSLREFTKAVDLVFQEMHCDVVNTNRIRSEVELVYGTLRNLDIEIKRILKPWPSHTTAKE